MSERRFLCLKPARRLERWNCHALDDQSLYWFEEPIVYDNARRPLSFPKIISARSDDAIRTRLV